MSTSINTASVKPTIVTTCHEIHDAVTQQRKMGRSVGLVPTMGALHEGHLSLVKASKQQCDVTVVTVFVNPTQFGPSEDLQQYPRTLDADVAALAACDVDLVFAPPSTEIYPAGFSTMIQPPAVARRWEGECRPGHFAGVATVVLKLFNIAPADVAFFGQKDFQQTLVVRDMVRDLNLPIAIRVCPTVRDPDGLAMSSRNTYLSADQRNQALALSRSLELANNLIQQAKRHRAGKIVASMKQVMSDAGIRDIDYVAVVDPDTLEPVDQVQTPVMVLVAAHVAQTRLIDNRRIG